MRELAMRGFLVSASQSYCCPPFEGPYQQWTECRHIVAVEIHDFLDDVVEHSFSIFVDISCQMFQLDLQHDPVDSLRRHLAASADVVFRGGSVEDFPLMVVVAPHETLTWSGNESGNTDSQEGLSSMLAHGPRKSPDDLPEHQSHCWLSRSGVKEP